jgi:hypothetical protein
MSPKQLMFKRKEEEDVKRISSPGSSVSTDEEEDRENLY